MLTTKQAATELGIQPGSVKKLCQRGILRAERMGRDWLISREEVERYKVERRSPGKPNAAHARHTAPSGARGRDMNEERIRKIAKLAGVDYARAYDWIVDPNGDWQNASPGTPKEEHDEWAENASDEEIANWLADGAR